jgi:integrase
MDLLCSLRVCVTQIEKGPARDRHAAAARTTPETAPGHQRREESVRVPGRAGPLDLDDISDVLHEAQKRAKVKRFGLHGVRHFFASALHQAGASLAQAQEALGHATIDMTAHYTHALESGREHVESVAQGFSSVVGLLAEGSPSRTRREAAQ